MEQLISPEIKIKRRIVYNFHSFLNLSRIDKIIAQHKNINGAIVLMYHSIASNKDINWIDPSNNINKDVFEKHMKFLANNRNVISLGKLIDSINDNRYLPRGTTVITFDDGYLNNLTNAEPILRKYNLPATIYLATGYIEREENQWIDQLYSYINERTRSKLLLPEIFNEEIMLNNSGSIWFAYSKIVKKLICSSYGERIRILTSIVKQLLPKQKPPKLTMNWNDIRKLINNKNISLGSHTYNHIDISGINAEKVKSEVQKCTEDIERETGRKSIHFSCPYSRSSKYLPRILNDMEYKSSVSDSTDILINIKSYTYDLGRVKAPISLSRLAHYTSGGYPWLSQQIIGRY